MRAQLTELVIDLLRRRGHLHKAMNQYVFRKVIGDIGRIFAWRALGVTIEEPTFIGVRVVIPQHPERVSIGGGCRLNGNVTIISFDRVTIGRKVKTNDAVWLLGGGHDPDTPDLAGKGGPIVIGDHAWLPVNITVLPNVTIGKGAVIGSGAVVASDIPDRGIAVGNPAQVVRERPDFFS